MSRLNMMILITQRSMLRKMQKFFDNNNVPMMLGTLGNGTASSEILDYFGLEASEKVILFSFLTDDTWKRIKRGLETEIQIDVPGTGIGFQIPLSSIGGKKFLNMVTDGQAFEREEESIMKETKYELVMVIANQGYSEDVMDAARSAGARGGTVIHAKGTGMEKAEKFLGVTIADEKELILIVTRKEEKNGIMKAIMEQAGLESKARSVAFSLPVSGTVGMRLQEPSDEVTE